MIEEYFRFAENNEAVAIALKKNRHLLCDLEQLLQPSRLIASRDTASDCFSDHNRPEELRRENGMSSLLAANFKRAQEACRVIEEYAKLSDVPQTSETAKIIRFSLYTLEQEQLTGLRNGKE